MSTSRWGEDSLYKKKELFFVLPALRYTFTACGTRVINTQYLFALSLLQVRPTSTHIGYITGTGTGTGTGKQKSQVER